jgi:hypothetical protein
MMMTEYSVLKEKVEYDECGWSKSHRCIKVLYLAHNS